MDGGGGARGVRTKEGVRNKKRMGQWLTEIQLRKKMINKIQVEMEKTKKNRKRKKKKIRKYVHTKDVMVQKLQYLAFLAKIMISISNESINPCSTMNYYYVF